MEHEFVELITKDGVIGVECQNCGKSPEDAAEVCNGIREDD